MNPTRHEKLENYFRLVRDIILSRQNWITGLLPASTAVTAHGDYTDAWVRDNVYSILAAWGLALAYRGDAADNGRTYLLEQSVVKLMRGLLTAMMRQAPKVEKFKHTQNPLDALHAKYNTQTGEVVVADHAWGHLQLDATSLFLLMLAQMTASGLRIVFTIDEVNFVQNLVHYISRAYRIPDYGVWERGDKINHGIAELNASSIGMAKAALEAMSGFNLFGKNGGQPAVIHVISDDIARMRITLESLLPRESLSKEADAAVLSIIGYPAFAVDNPAICTKAEQVIREKLEGRYGCKRFLLDGHQTAIEDTHKLHYDPHELKQFTDIECEWPLFFTYSLLNHLFRSEFQNAADYRAKLDRILVERNGQRLLPELYRVPLEAIDAEKKAPHSQTRLPNENIPLVWAQSLFILGCLIQDGLLEIDEIDPLGRYKVAELRHPCRVQIQLVAEDESVQKSLLDLAIHAQTLAEIAPIQIREASELAEAYTQVGRNNRIGLSGRPLRQLRTMATSRIYVLAGESLLFVPQCLNQKGFYIAMDNRLVIQRLRLELAYVHRHWDKPDHPLVVLPIKQNMLDGQYRENLIEFIRELQQGSLDGIPVRLGSVKDFEGVTCHEKIDYLHDFQFSEASWKKTERPCASVLPSDGTIDEHLDGQLLTALEISDDNILLERLRRDANLYAQLEVLSLLKMRHGLDYGTGLKTSDGTSATVRDLLDEVYERAGDRHIWHVVRRSAALLGKYDINLEQSANEILLRQHALTVGRSYSGRATLKRPCDSSEILRTIYDFNSESSEQIIIQELIIYLGMLIKSNPELFTDLQTVRVGHILQLMIGKFKREAGCSSLDWAFNKILALPPYQLSIKLKEMLKDYSNTKAQLIQAETLHFVGDYHGASSFRLSDIVPDHSEDVNDWYEWREQQGSVGRENDAFFSSIRTILQHCKGLTIGDKFNTKNRLDSEAILSRTTEGERSFKLHVSHLLNKIQAPVYRQLTVEALQAIASIVQQNESVQIDDTILTDVVIGHGVRLCWLQNHPENSDQYEQSVALAWQNFYQLPPPQVANQINGALTHLLHNNYKE